MKTSNEFVFKFNHPDYTPYTYQVRSFEKGVYTLFAGTTVIGTLRKIGDSWEQISGRVTLQELIDAIGEYIDKELWK